MKKQILNLGKSLNKAEQKTINGGRLFLSADTYNCKCNGHPIGTASSSAGCAAKCYACVSNGGCAEQ
jgi:hypothetical protein